MRLSPHRSPSAPGALRPVLGAPGLRSISVKHHCVQLLRGSGTRASSQHPPSPRGSASRGCQGSVPPTGWPRMADACSLPAGLLPPVARGTVWSRRRFWLPLAPTVLGAPCLVAASPLSLPLSLHRLLSSVSVSLLVKIASHWTRGCHDLVLTNDICKDPVCEYSHSECPGGHDFGERVLANPVHPAKFIAFLPSCGCQPCWSSGGTF